MKAIILFILLLNSSSTFGQLPDDSLKSICLNQFHKDKFLFFNPANYVGNKFDIRASFDDYFEKLKIIEIYDLDSLVIHSYKYKSPPARQPFRNSYHPIYNLDSPITNTDYYFSKENPFLFYLIDRYTGKIIDVKNEDAFNGIMNSSIKKFSNLDKCYLYLLLNHVGGNGILGPRGYPSTLVSAKEIRIIESGVFNSLLSKEISCSEYADILSKKKSSTNRSIYVFVIMNKDEENTACRYNFIFDEYDNLSQIKKDCYE